MKQKRVVEFAIQDLWPIALTLIVLGIGVTYGLDIMDDNKSQLCDYTYVNGQCLSCPAAFPTYNTTAGNCYNASSATTAWVDRNTAGLNATNDAVTGLSKLPEKLPTIVTVIVAAVVIGVLVRYFMRS